MILLEAIVLIVKVEMGVATNRPPKIDRLSNVIVDAETETEALLVACQMTLVWADVVMPVHSKIIEILEI